MYSDHDHRGEYADERHNHDNDYAPLHHRHHDLEREDERLQGGLREAMAQVDQLRREYEEQLARAFERIRALEGQTPQARQLQLEADQAAADLADSGYDRHGRGCQCAYCACDEDEPDESTLARRNACIGTWSCQDVTRRQL